MALALNVSTRFPVGTGNDTTSGDRTFSHAATGTPVGVIVVLSNESSSADGVTGITYGSTTLAKAVTASDTSEAGRVTVWTSHRQTIATGTQTVTLQGCSTAQKVAACATVTAATTMIEVNASNKVDTTTSANPTVTVVTSATTMLFGGVHGGNAAPTSYTVGSGYTTFQSHDFGALAGKSQRSTNPVAAGSIAFDFTAVSEDWCIAAAAIAEYTAPAGGRPKVWNGSSWVEKPVMVWNGSSWVEKPMKYWDGDSWELV